MSETSVSNPTERADAAPIDETFDALGHTLDESGPAAAIDLLVQSLDARGEYRAMLDALLLKARFELGLPLVQVGGFSEIPEALREKYEEKYVAAIREVGGKLLATGDIAGAFPYYRAIGETSPVTKAIDDYQPANDDRLTQVVEVAFNQGAHPRKGFELILNHYGTCSAITAFEHLPRDESIRTACADLLVKQLHEHLTASLRAEIAQRGQPLPAEGAPIPALLEGKDWLFQDDAYHIDVSHLSSTVRIAPLTDDPKTLALAAELTDYGRKLSGRHRYEGDPPFEDVYEDHRIYLRALLGHDQDAAIAHFQAKLDPTDREVDPGDTVAAQVLVGLLSRIGRLDDAITVAKDRLAGIPESALFCPGVSQLCQRAGKPQRLAEIARDQADLVSYTAALLQMGRVGSSTGSASR